MDIVCLDGRHKPDWCVDVKWSDRYARRPRELSSLEAFTSRHPDLKSCITTRTLMKRDGSWPGEARLDFVPTSFYCYMVGHRAIRDPSAEAAWVVGG